MNPGSDTIYDDARTRVCALVTALSTEQLHTPVPATPEWTARQLLAHLAGVASDAVHQRTEGWPGPSWTAPQVEQREDHTLTDITTEWAHHAPAVRQGITERRISPAIVHDVLTHEADLREAFGLPQLPDEALDPALDMLAKIVVRRAARHGTLILRTGTREWQAGRGEPVVALTAEPYELYRGLMSRRSRAQMRAWAHSGDPEPYLDTLPVFGAHNDDRPRV